jgi:hypothetical protein
MAAAPGTSRGGAAGSQAVERAAAPASSWRQRRSPIVGVREGHLALDVKERRWHLIHDVPPQIPSTAGRRGMRSKQIDKVRPFFLPSSIARSLPTSVQIQLILIFIMLPSSPLAGPRTSSDATALGAVAMSLGSSFASHMGTAFLPHAWLPGKVQRAPGVRVLP